MLAKLLERDGRATGGELRLRRVTFPACLPHTPKPTFRSGLAIAVFLSCIKFGDILRRGQSRSQAPVAAHRPRQAVFRDPQEQWGWIAQTEKETLLFLKKRFLTKESKEHSRETCSDRSQS